MTEHPRSVSIKEDPQTLVLRGRPRPAVRFRRGMIVGISGAVAAALITLSWLSLQPPSLRRSSPLTDDDDPAHKAVPDALASVPSNYQNVPRLGPPLPGDLGGPILERERSLTDPQASDSFASSPAIEREQEARAAEQRIVAERQAARASSVIVELQGSSKPETAAAGVAGPGDMPSASSRPEGQSGLDGAVDLKPEEFSQASPRFRVNAGTIIPASLLTGLNSDLPGTVIAQVTESVCDSATGRTVLIPQGARLVGTYDSASAYGQRRARVVWKRIVFPNGSSVLLDNLAATDAAGFTGLNDKVDSHTWQLLKGIAMSTLFGVGTQLSFGSGESALVRAIRESAQQNASDAGNQITSRNLGIRPTIIVRPGWPVRAIVDEDLVLEPWSA